MRNGNSPITDPIIVMGVAHTVGQWSTQQGSFMSEMHGTSLLITPGQFGPVLLPQLSKNDGEEHCFLK